MTLGSNSCKTNFYIRFLSRNFEIKCHSRSFHQLFFISLFLEVEFSEAVISKCHFLGAAVFQCHFSVPVVTEVSPRAAPLRLFIQLIKIYTYKLSLLLGPCLSPWTHIHGGASGIPLPLDHSFSCSSLNVLHCLIHHAVRACTIQKLIGDFSWGCICNFVLSRTGYLEADFPTLPCKIIVLWCHPWSSLCLHPTDQLL